MGSNSSMVCDTTEAEKVSDIIIRKMRLANKKVIWAINKIFGRIKVNEDIYGNDPRLFYDVILRKRNYYNAAFCCGAGSIHRREAVMGLALKDFAQEMQKLEHNLMDQH